MARARTLIAASTAAAAGAYLARTMRRPRTGSRWVDSGLKVEKAITINRPSPDLYAFWRDLANLPKFFDHLDSVEVLDQSHSRWTVEAPLGQVITWDAEIVTDTPNELIAWRSLPGSALSNAGSVRFHDAPAGHGSEVRVNLEWLPPAGDLGAALARMFGDDPESAIREDLRRLKRLIETGEIPTNAMYPGQGES